MEIISTRQKVECLRKEGRSYNEIMDILGISKSCVHWHASEKNREYARKKRRENRSNFTRDQKIKRGGKCNRCGYSKCLAALHFHHIDPATKIQYKDGHGAQIGVGGIKHRANQQKALDEMDKCELICANCHAEEHYC